MNINSQDYWDERFLSGSWEAKMGRDQTAFFAKDILRLINIPPQFSGKILDFGCALGDACFLFDLWIGQPLTTKCNDNLALFSRNLFVFASLWWWHPV